MKKVIIINGPNLNMLGKREPEFYGKDTLKNIEDKCIKESKVLGIDTSFFQSNHEGELIDKIQKSTSFDGLIINAGALTHTSIAIHDALKTLKISKIEIHISNIYSRENFRKNSFISSVVDGIIAGFGTHVYIMALNSVKILIENE